MSMLVKVTCYWLEIKMAESQKDSTDNTLKHAVLQPPIIMQTETPNEINGKEIEENKNNTQTLRNEEFKICSPLFRSTIQNNPFASPQNKISKGILKPPQFSLNNKNSSASFILKPSQLNPLSKTTTTASDNISEKTETSDTKVNPTNGDMPKFVPLVVPDKTIPNSNESNQTSVNPNVSSSSNSFVFGQNLKERVIANEKEEMEGTSKASTSLGSNGTSEMLFSSAIKHEVKPDSVSKDKETKTLSESAREYEESRAHKRKYEEVEVITGEEDENNILNISCKLFSFNKVSSSWLELGRGTLRLNDFNNNENNSDHIGSRLVFRASGSLRLILNTKVWAEMVVEKANEKSIRITALDATGEIKVFLVMSNIEDSNRLYSNLHSRLEREIAAQKRKTMPSEDN